MARVASPTIENVDAQLLTVEAQISVGQTNDVGEKPTDARTHWDQNLNCIQDECESKRECMKCLRTEKERLRKKEQFFKEEQLRDEHAPRMCSALMSLEIPSAMGFCRLKGNFAWPCGDLGCTALFVRPCYEDLQVK